MPTRTSFASAPPPQLPPGLTIVLYAIAHGNSYSEPAESTINIVVGDVNHDGTFIIADVTKLVDKLAASDYHVTSFLILFFLTIFALHL